MRKFIKADKNDRSATGSVEEWLADNHLSRFVVQVVSQLDLSAITTQIGNRGGSVYSPEMMVSLLFYSYASGTYSSRKIERQTHESIPVRYICGNHHPDHDTIANFRKRFFHDLSDLFVQILLYAQELGFGHVGQVNVDGTKIAANASKHSAMSLQRIVALMAKYEQESKRLLELAEQADNTPTGLDIPAELSRREEMQLKLAHAKAVIEERQRQANEHKRAEYEAKMEQRRAKEELIGRKLGGKVPAAPIEQIDPKAQFNFTDPESRIMKTKDGYGQCFNAQAAVTNDMLIVGAILSNHPLDVLQLESVLDAIPTQAGKVAYAAADTGYYSLANSKACLDRGIEPYLATGRLPHRNWLNEQLESVSGQEAPTGATGRPSREMTDKELMGQKLRTAKGKQIYGHRKMTSEPTFGIIKEQMNFRRFSCRGLSLVGAEWLLVAAAYNIKRLYGLTMEGTNLTPLKAKEAGNGENSVILLRNIFQQLYRAWCSLVTEPFTSKLYSAGQGQTSFSPTAC
jgi:transposase